MSRQGALRWYVHLGLILTASVSLLFEPILMVHIVIGLVFAAFVAAHLAQRRRVSTRLLRRLTRVRTLPRPGGRLALADASLTLVTAVMLVSGFWDWFAEHPTRIRWHAIAGFGLAAFLLVHTVNRRSRLRASHVH